MWYAIIARDRADSLQDRQAARPAHLRRLEKLQAQGRVLLAGPLPAIDASDPGPAGFAGSLMVIEFDSLAEAREWAGQDPYVTGGVFKSWDVYPFRQVLP